MMTSPTQHRHEELVALLTEIRDRLPEPLTYTVETRTGRKAEPVDATEEPPCGSQVTDREGDIWERREDGWTVWWPERRGWISDLYGGGRDPWPTVRNHTPLRPTTDEDRVSVGLPVEEACDCGSRPEEIGGAAHRIGCPAPAPADEDPDEALARVLYETECEVRWEGAGVVARDTYRDLARAAREHIEANQLYAYRTVAAERDKAEADADEVEAEAASDHQETR